MGVLKSKWTSGKARLKDCVDCGKQAYRWTQMPDTDGGSPDHYEPRCQECAWLHGGETPRPMPRAPRRGGDSPRG